MRASAAGLRRGSATDGLGGIHSGGGPPGLVLRRRGADRTSSRVRSMASSASSATSTAENTPATRWRARRQPLAASGRAQMPTPGRARARRPIAPVVQVRDLGSQAVAPGDDVRQAGPCFRQAAPGGEALSICCSRAGDTSMPSVTTEKKTRSSSCDLRRPRLQVRLELQVERCGARPRASRRPRATPGRIRRARRGSVTSSHRRSTRSAL
jgi:hypothetical protein